jgi:ribonuclease BN (tRNA processing enzyme)
VELIVLGASGTYPTRHHACSGYLLREEGFTLWMDAGNGTLAHLQEHVAIDDLDAVYISHTHPDHCADLYPFYYRMLISGRRVPFYTPPGARERLATLSGSPDRFAELPIWHELGPGDTTQIGPFSVRTWEARHSVPTNIARVTAGGRTLTYSGDTAPCDALVEAAEDADLFLCEASWLEPQPEGPIHSTAEQTGLAGNAARAERLMLTPIWPHLDLAAVRGQASDAYGAAVELAIETEGTEV